AGHAADAAAAPVCPSPEAVWRATATLLARDGSPVEVRDDDRAALVTDDQGDRYRVSFRGVTRAYADAGHDCARRAQVAAVFVALALVPPEVELPVAPPPADETAAETPSGPGRLLFSAAVASQAAP